MKAVVDTATWQSVVGTYLLARSGDYDLFAVFPRRASHDREGLDKRMVPGSERFRQPIAHFIEHEDPRI